VLNSSTDLGSHALKLLIVVGLSQEILAGVNELVTKSIRFDALLKQVLGPTGRVVQNRFYPAAFRSLAS
jgi:hypothetical protein